MTLRSRHGAVSTRPCRRSPFTVTGTVVSPTLVTLFPNGTCTMEEFDDFPVIGKARAP